MAVDIFRVKRLMFGKFWKMQRQIALVAIAFLVTTSIGTGGALGQMPPQLSPPGNSRAQSSASPLEGIGNIVHHPVLLDGRQVLDIAAYQSNTMDKQKGDLPIRRRASLIESNLYGILDRGFDPETLQVSHKDVEDKTILVAADGKGLDNVSIATITNLDARVHGLHLDELAEETSKSIKLHLIRARQEREAEYLLRQGLISGAIIILAIALSFLVLRWQKELSNKFDDKKLALGQENIDQLQEQSSSPQDIGNDDISADNAEPSEPSDVLEEGRDVNDIQKLLLQILFIGIWLGSIAWIVGLFPWTRWLQFWIVAEPIALVGSWLGTRLAIRGSHFLIDRIFHRLQAKQSSEIASSQRQLFRISTVAHILKSISYFIWGFLGILLVLETLRIPLGPVLAGAGILGFAISFASQSFIKDVVNGCLIFWEDWYAVGDEIILGGVLGKVEYMNLRVTELRTIAGELMVMPNSEITSVINRTKKWSRANIKVQVGYDAELKLAMETMKEVAEQMHDDPKWQEHILDPVEMLGVNGITHSGIDVEIRIKTKPGKQGSVAREYRYRLKHAFDELSIGIGIPQQKNVASQ